MLVHPEVIRAISRGYKGYIKGLLGLYQGVIRVITESAPVGGCQSPRAWSLNNLYQFVRLLSEIIRVIIRVND